MCSWCNYQIFTHLFEDLKSVAVIFSQIIGSYLRIKALWYQLGFFFFLPCGCLRMSIAVHSEQTVLPNVFFVLFCFILGSLSRLPLFTTTSFKSLFLLYDASLTFLAFQFVQNSRIKSRFLTVEGNVKLGCQLGFKLILGNFF